MNARALRASMSARLFCLVLSWMLLTPPTLFPARAIAARVKGRATTRSVAPPATPAPPATRRAGELLVRFRAGTTEQERAAVSNSARARREVLSGGSGVERLRFDSDANAEAAGASLAGNPSVEYVEPNYLIKADESMPDDPRFVEQWALRNAGEAGGQSGSDIGATRAWDATTGSEKTVIAVIDSGIDFTHPDLKSNRWTNHAERENNKDDDRNGLADDLHGWDWVARSNEIKDESGHGTAVAGIIAAEGNNGLGVSGVMWRAGLMSLRVLDETGTGDVAGAVEAIDYAVAQGAHVINLSWGTEHESKALKDALSRAARAGALVVCSAGNDGRNIDGTPHYPASYDLPNLVAVASTDNSDQLASWSNWGGTRATVAAPGTDILTTERGGGYRAASGSSFSAPHVAGVAGLIRTLRPRLSAGRTREVLVRGVRQTASLQGKVATGGVVNAVGSSGAAQSLSPHEGGEENSPDAADENNDAHGSNAGGLTTGANAQQESASGRAPVKGRPASNLPDLDVTRRHQPTRPKAPEPIRSTQRNCPPNNPRCNGDGKLASHTATQPARPARAAERARYVEVAALNTGAQPGVYPASVTAFGSGRDGLGYSISDSPSGLSWVARSLNNGGTGVFAAITSNTSAGVAFQGDAAAFVSQTVPSPMITGQTYHVRITMRNTGTTTWTPENSYRLGALIVHAPNCIDYDDRTWRLDRVQLPAHVPPGAEVTFNFEVTAPQNAGTYDFQWGMVRDGLHWFNNVTTKIPVSVIASDYQGSLDMANCDTLNGWLWDASRPNTRIEVDLFADNKFLTRIVADQYRPDLLNAGKGDGRYAYSIQTPAALCDSQPHTITARVANTMFTNAGTPFLSGSPASITCAPRPPAPSNTVTNAVPGIIQAEDFDQGANGTAYYDGTPGNYGSVYRTGSNDWVDIEGCVDGSCGYWLNWVHDGEWTKYTINVAFAGTYTIETAVASTHPGGAGLDGSFRIEIDGMDVSGAITVGDTGGVWQTRPSTGIQLTAGQHVMKVTGRIATGSNGTGWAGRLDRFTFTRSGGSVAGGRTPYSGAGAFIPGIVQAEDFDQGANGVAYYDGTSGNYGSVYRTGSNDWVDIEGCADGSCGYWLSWVHDGEWTEYTINVAATGDYNVVADVASMYSSAYADGSFRIEVDGAVKATGLSVPNTGGSWQATNPVTMNLTAGQHVMRVVGISGITGWAGKLDRLRFTTVGDTGGNNFSEARLRPGNRTGGGNVDLLSGNFNWGLPLVSLQGRSGLDLGLSLAYNSLVWTRDGGAIQFNSDNGYPAPGFRLGFPTIQQRYTNAQTNRFAYLLITPSGSRVELLQVGASNIYEATDSSYLQLIDYGGSMLLRATDGTQLTFKQMGFESKCTQVKDRNGNFITVEYDSQGGLSAVKDTLSRVINFNYDQYHNLLSITQDRSGRTHTWATFGYATKEFVSPFNGLTVLGALNNQPVSVLAQVGLADGSSYRFDYTSALQVSAIRRYSADNHQLAYTAYNLSTGSDDCPRVTMRKDWAMNWNNGQEAMTNYLRSPDGSWGQATTPDDTTYKEFFATSGWRKGLTTRTEVWAASVLKKWTTTEWTQDDVNVAYQLNPRPYDTSIHDPEGNLKRTSVNYTSYGLPQEVREYAADGQTVLRRTLTQYNFDAAFINRRIIGLPVARFLYEGENTLLAKTDFHYDWGGGYFSAQTPSVQHDGVNYSANFIYGRGNLTGVRRFNKDAPDDANHALWQQLSSYNAAGSPVFSRDANWHTTHIDYTDVDANGNNLLNTLAYSTKVTDAGGFASKVRYNYDMGMVVRTEGVSPDAARFAEGAVQVLAYDAAGRLERTTNTVNGMYKRYVYAPGQNWVQTFTTVRDAQTESYVIQVLDGAGRVYAAAGDLPGSNGKYSGQHTVYDALGRAVRVSNPTEINNGWVPAGDDSQGWRYSTQDYDWKGRPTYSTYPDGGMNQELIYGGCGCAGGETVTVRDAMGRRQRMTSDVLGRLWKSEVYDAGGIYSTTINTYNARDQLTGVEERQGISGTAKQTSMTYDGHGRLATRKTPLETNATHYAYHPDDTLSQVTDARGVVETVHYNSRHLVTGRTYHNEGTGIEAASDVWYDYDAAGNRLWMLDGLGRVDYIYDRLSRLTKETRQFWNTGSFPLSYSYTAGGQLQSVTDWQHKQVNYGYDQTGRLNHAAPAAPYEEGVPTYASNMEYRAWGALKKMTYGSGRVLAQSYNARLQLAHFEIAWPTPQHGAPAMSANYTYYADGRIKFVDDLMDDRFDRAYGYDHAARLSRGLSGTEARVFVGLPAGDTTVGPYSQVYSYDVWGNLTGRAGQHWSKAQSFTAEYTEANRRVGWNYDAAGNVTSDDSRYGRQYTYDSAGRKTVATEHQVQGGGQATRIETHLTLRQGADGDGRSARREEGRVTRLNNGAPQTTVEVTYYVRSSVLGAVIGEVNAQGQQQKGYVYANGQMVAKQWGGLLYWQQSNPVTGSTRSEATAGHVYADEESGEPDPLGNDMGKIDPYAADGLADYAGDYTSGGNGFDQSGGGCTIDYMPRSCSDARRLRAAGVAQQCPDNDCGARVQTVIGRDRHGREVTSSSRLILPGEAGWDGAFDGTYRRGEVPRGDMTLYLAGRFFNRGSGGINGTNPFEYASFFAPQKTSRDQFTAKQFEQFKSCLKSMFQVEYKGHHFARGEESYFDGYTNRGAHFYSLKAIGDFTVRTDQQSYSSQELTRKYTGFFGDTGGKLLAGYTDPGSPYVNAIAYDAGMLIKGSQFLAVWVHELGNSLSSITRISPDIASDAGDRYDGDTDAGTAFEDCVFGGRVKSDGSVSSPK